MHVSLIIQARMSSTRLPQKVLKPFKNKPMLLYLVDRLKKSPSINQIIIAISVNPADDVLEKFCQDNLLLYHRGPETNVLTRYLEVAEKFNCQHMIRVTSDCPLHDPLIINKMILYFLTHDCEYLQNALFTYGYPSGFDCAIYHRKTLEKFNQIEKNIINREHASGAIVKYPDLFKIDYFTDLNIDYSHYHLSVDTIQDYKLITKIINNFPNDNFTFDDVIEYLKSQEITKNWHEDKTSEYKIINNQNRTNETCIILHGVANLNDIKKQLTFLSAYPVILVTYKHLVNDSLFELIDRKYVHLIKSIKKQKKKPSCTIYDKKNKFYIDVDHQFSYSYSEKDKAKNHRKKLLNKWRFTNSCNLNLFTSKKGIEMAQKLYPKSKYYLRLRVDLVIENINQEINQWKNIVQKSSTNSDFQKVMISPMYVYSQPPFNFYANDYLLFGTKEDIVKYYTKIPYLVNQKIFDRFINQIGKNSICPERYFIASNFKYPTNDLISLSDFDKHCIKSVNLPFGYWKKKGFNKN